MLLQVNSQTLKVNKKKLALKGRSHIDGVAPLHTKWLSRLHSKLQTIRQ
jgi:hypothetical protein